MKPNWLDVNSLGPFNHTNFTFQGRKCSHEGVLAGREDFLKSLALSSLEKFEFDKAKRRQTIRILEIGSYDGFISNYLFHQGFRKIITFEGRKENINKGKHLRKVLNEHDGVRHLRIDAEKIPKFFLRTFANRFDFVICFGLLHHLQNSHKFLGDVKKLLSPNGVLLLETVSLDDSSIDDKFQRAMEAKDILYRDGNTLIGFLGLKFESNYFPGSTIQGPFTTVPSERALQLLLTSVGMRIISKSKGWEELVTPQSLGHRQAVHTTVIRSEKINSPSILDRDGLIDSAIEDYEDTFCLNFVHDNKIEILQQLESDKEKQKQILNNYIFDTKDTAEKKILRSIMYEPRPKILFEHSKNFLQKGQRAEARRILKSLVEDDFCEDWRTTYRSLYLLGVIDSKKYLRYAKLCNPNFPIATLEKMFKLYR